MGAGMIDIKIEKLFIDWQRKEFKYGETDCCQFAAFAMLAIHDVEIKLPSYDSERGAYRIVRRLGGLSAALENNGLKRLSSPLLASRGDVVLIKHKNGGLFREALAVCMGRFAYTTAKTGLVEIGQQDWLEAWKVNHG
jgi:hypothetical protein